MRLPPAQLRAAALAMSPSWCVFPDPFDGPSIRTLRALKRRGWLEPDDPDDPEGEWSWTDAGWAAVAPAPTPAPGDAVAALRLALKALVGDATGLYRSADVPRQWFTSDDVAHDFGDALAVLDVAELMEADALSRALDTADEEVLLQLCEAAGEAVTRWGFPVEVSSTSGPGGACVSYWPE